MRCWWLFDVSNYLDVWSSVAVYASSEAEAIKIIEDKLEYPPKEIQLAKAELLDTFNVLDEADIILNRNK